ncbi:MAG TPA: pitrilysin family protein [Verrucomicrobiae bacterium]|jgi:predicted Zn-dependent peptidase|nr:pitrilysin family protein [Verrucomicrobiae bacterium]
MRRLILKAAVASLLLFYAPSAEPAAPARKAKSAPSAQKKIPPQKIDVPFRVFTLKNGLRVILSEDHAAPTYSLNVTYSVGSRNEPPGKTGFAHLFEHMMFQGSENVGKGEHFIVISNNGGRMNGTTNSDRTNYFETLPKNQLELGLFLEADRMRALNVTQENFDNQRQTVKEERRQNYDNRAYGKTGEALLDLAYDNFAYKHSTIGSMEDLDRSTIEDARQFYKTYYAPNNAVLSLVGDFNADEALAMIKKYFEAIPSHPHIPPVDMTEPPQKAERRRTIEDPFAQTPRIDVVYKIPRGNTPDWYALDVLGDVMTSGDSSRFYQLLVKEKEVATGISAGPDERRGPSLFYLTIFARPGEDLRAIEKLAYAEIDRLKTGRVAAWELEKVRMQSRHQRAQGLYSTQSRANQLSHYAVYFNDPGLVNTVETKIEKVTPADLQRVARTYLNENNRTVLITMPKAAAKESTSK